MVNILNPGEVAAEIIRVNALPLTDGDLTLHLTAIAPTPYPDAAIPRYEFQMRHTVTGTPLGEINLRAGTTANITLYRGHIGYTVHSAHQGHAYAARSCRLLMPFIHALGFPHIVLTCNPGNAPSRQSIVKTGATYLDTVTIHNTHPHIDCYPPESRTKLRFQLNVENPS